MPDDLEKLTALMVAFQIAEDRLHERYKRFRTKSRKRDGWRAGLASSGEESVADFEWLVCGRVDSGRTGLLHDTAFSASGGS